MNMKLNYTNYSCRCSESDGDDSVSEVENAGPSKLAGVVQDARRKLSSGTSLTCLLRCHSKTFKTRECLSTVTCYLLPVTCYLAAYLERSKCMTNFLFTQMHWEDNSRPEEYFGLWDLFRWTNSFACRFLFSNRGTFMCSPCWAHTWTTQYQIALKACHTMAI